MGSETVMYKIAGIPLEIRQYVTDSGCMEFSHERLFGFQAGGEPAKVCYEFRMEQEIDLREYTKVPARINRNLYRSGDKWLFLQTDREQYPYAVSVNSDWSFATVFITPESIAYLKAKFGGQFEEKIQLYHLKIIMENFRFSVIGFREIYLHGVFMEYRGKGIVLSAPSQTGKSTHAALWVRDGECEIINGDNCVIRRDMTGNAEGEKAGGGEYPTEDAGYLVCGLPWCGSSGIFLNKTLPLEAVVFLEQSSRNEAYEITQEEAFYRYYQRCFRPEWDITLTERLTAAISDLVSSSKSYVLRCRPDQEAVEVLKRCLKL